VTKGPHRQVLDQYLDTAAEGRLTGAGFNWKQKANDLEKLSEALTSAAQQAELRIGEQTLTGPALRAGMEESATSLALKAEQLRAAGEALTQVGRQLSDARDARDALTALGDKPPAYQAPAGTPGVEPTDEEIAAQAAASQARQSERTAWQTEYDKQEAKALALTKDMDAAFLGAIPPMKEIHGEKDPTEPTPQVPSGPGGPYLPGTQAPPPTGGGGGGSDGEPRVFLQPDPKDPDPGPKDPEPKDPEPRQPDPDLVVCTLSPPEHDVRTPIPPPPTTTVIGTSQDGITYQPSGPTVSTPVSATPSGPSAAALGAAGAAGGAGALASGSVRGATPAGTRSATPVRAIGATGRAGSAGALSRSAGSSASSAAPRSAGAAGSPASRSAATGSSGGRGGAGGRGAAAAGSSSGQRAGGRGSAGARSAGAAGSGARGRKGDRDRTTDRDSLVYDQDWLGEDDVAPGVLD